MDDTTVWVFNLLCGYWLYEKYENKAVKRYFMDVSRANFYAKLCMKLGAYEKRLWNYFKIMSSENLYFFTALILLLFLWRWQLKEHSFDKPPIFTRFDLLVCKCFLFQIPELEKRLFSHLLLFSKWFGGISHWKSHGCNLNLFVLNPHRETTLFFLTSLT